MQPAGFVRPLVLLRMALAFAFGWFAAEVIYVDIVPFRHVPPGLPEEYAANVMQIGYPRSRARQGGFLLRNSPLLAREFPDYVFIQVGIPRVRYSNIIGVSATEPRRWKFPDEIWAFFIHTRRRIRTVEDVERLRRVATELCPLYWGRSVPWTSPLHQHVADGVWRMSVEALGVRSEFYELRTDRDGTILSIQQKQIRVD